ncbi:helix-turn-helix protein [Arcicella aurantiaca]|uniref:Helix-turn-helix protein n=1 Tax=Arcicella aurantiaca TaxID=591202 RepID=A0A316EI04_9BACT|nr:helix-turn-helix transcriptional regulator [Arcicella aurantiaca]PWK29178.1 helix-turn-helix protein [Arcicella aurantiaca]
MENKFGSNIKVLRKKNKLTLEILGKILGVSKSALSDYENGHTVPSLDVCETIGNYFGVNLDELQNSDFSEMSLEEIQQNAKLRSASKKEEDKNDLSDPYNQLVFQNKLLNQQVDGLQIQLQLVKQLFESKVSEIKSLQVQIKLLEEKLNH